MKTNKRIISLLLVLTVIISLFSSCKEKRKDTTPVVMTLGDKVISEAKYQYFASVYLGEYITEYDDVQGNADAWDRKLPNGETFAEYLDRVTLEKIKYTLVSMKLFDDYGLSLTDDEKQSIEDYVSDLCLDKTDGDKEEFDNYLAAYGVNSDILEEIYNEDAKTTKVYEYLFGENGKEKLGDEDYEEYYLEHYVHFQMIYINNAYRYAEDENGFHYTDDDGYYVTEPLDGEEKREKDEKVSIVEEKLSSGEDFYAVYDEFSEIKAYPDGYYYSPEGEYGDEVFYTLTGAASELDTGKWKKVETDTGTCFVMREDLGSGAWKDSSNKDFFGDMKDAAGDESYRRYMESYYGDIKTDEEKLAKFSVKNLIPAYFY